MSIYEKVTKRKAKPFVGNETFNDILTLVRDGHIVESTTSDQSYARIVYVKSEDKAGRWPYKIQYWRDDGEMTDVESLNPIDVEWNTLGVVTEEEVYTYLDEVIPAPYFPDEDRPMPNELFYINVMFPEHNDVTRITPAKYNSVALCFMGEQGLLHYTRHSAEIMRRAILCEGS